ncbi:GNA1162 family protein [Shewanella halifaxensis]|uniref:GNA1162 family protein n=1 Tax=Shewanella halifaxensis TaxID=271098 RepID=UPI000D58E639|nr:GNA1162 family protein [Shewanella halifaxensis]
MKQWTKLISILFVGMMVSGCVNTLKKQDAFPEMYTNTLHENILIAPVINKSTSSEASEYLNSTLAEPFVNKGYYVLPVPITTEVFKGAGIIDGTELKGIPFSTYKEKFGADMVLFVTIEQWDTNYLVVAGNVTVGLKYVMVSTQTSKIIWSYSNTVVVDTGSNSGSLLVDLIATAIATATTDYIPVAQQVNLRTTQSLPVGHYHPRYKKDGSDMIFEANAADAAKAFSE